jgi:hypothetical protein
MHSKGYRVFLSQPHASTTTTMGWGPVPMHLSFRNSGALAVGPGPVTYAGTGLFRKGWQWAL